MQLIIVHKEKIQPFPGSCQHHSSNVFRTQLVFAILNKMDQMKCVFILHIISEMRQLLLHSHRVKALRLKGKGI